MADSYYAWLRIMPDFVLYLTSYYTWLHIWADFVLMQAFMYIKTHVGPLGHCQSWALQKEWRVFKGVRSLCTSNLCQSHIFWVNTWMSNGIQTCQLRRVLWPKVRHKHMWHSLSVHNWQYLWLLKTFLLLVFFSPSTDISTHQQWTLPIQIIFHQCVEEF